MSFNTPQMFPLFHRSFFLSKQKEREKKRKRGNAFAFIAGYSVNTTLNRITSGYFSLLSFFFSFVFELWEQLCSSVPPRRGLALIQLQFEFVGNPFTLAVFATRTFPSIGRPSPFKRKTVISGIYPIKFPILHQPGKDAVKIIERRN